MPVAVYVLGLSVFALGTSEFMLSGLLPPIAEDMGVTIPQAGLLISAFAIGMVIGAPLLAVATLRLPRRTTLVSLISLFGLGQVAGALAPSYELLFASRVVSALACAGFWAVGAAVAIAMVDKDQRARAMAVMIGGLSIANVLGVPAGAFLGEHLGWRSAFWSVGAASAIALAGILVLIPKIPLPAEKPRLGRELRIYRDRQVWLAIGITALAAGGVFCAFSYLSPLLTDVAGLDSRWVPWILGLFGLGALVGTTIGGRVADAHLFGVMLWGITASTVFLAALALLAGTAAAAVALSFLLGFSAFFTAPALNARMFNVAGAAPTLAGATTTAAFNLGNTGGPWLGGTVIDAGLGFSATAWAGAAMTVTAIALTAIALRLDRRRPHPGTTRVVASSESAPTTASVSA
ncbi:Cmx/CmrA family chloramphenicol efflux MFS transporter [Streptomyces antarcticus]|uniref:Cmx/CmrA family chloramphenicol efflux MFS transporter n=1 Tax=Streptomyces antarcticus TaxID=2996458 RepID=UPI00226D69DD|nr:MULTISPECIES: Cmx/CmrA family chloramphenicol efflux MFS transporter [unclassified Streptomyces]MCY0947694.1 MFS transporter [Streptomyces sp. H34-AA3]MCY0955206.1 MFS transporter [Streptomyces sp. H27-S2]MCZ4085559.1 MFS transporter [Streptomyces sp. H34-S5]